MIWQDPICEMEINITPQLMTYASIPGLVDMVIENRPDAKRDDFGLKRKILPQKRVNAPAYNTNAGSRNTYGASTPDMQPNRKSKDLTKAMMSATSSMAKRQHSRDASFQSNTRSMRTPVRAYDAAVTRSGVPADQIAQRLVMHKTKTEAKLEKERQSKIQRELELMT